MSRKILIDAAHPEETRVVVVNGNHIEEFDFESEHKKQLKGNIYLARVTRVEPSLQAAFVEYGESKQGFLAFQEIHPDYYQIPLADKAALLEAQRLQAEKQKQKDEEVLAKAGKQKSKTKIKDAANDEESDDVAANEIDDNDVAQEDKAIYSEVEYLKRYKIQEVIKKRQILLVQILKDERGNKGASLTTYLSLAGRYAVLMPNRSRGGGISRKITDATDRKRLKKIVQDLEVPSGMGVILRTAGEKRNKNEIKRDYEYLIRLWDKIRTLTLNSIAPTLVHEESNLIKRCIRDLYDKTISEILVAGDTAYREAKDFMRMLMPSQSKVVQPYKDIIPIYSKYHIEPQLLEIFNPQVSLQSGGYLIINQTEALVSIDVNSGRSTKETSVESTALQTNLEAAEELARQLRLRDLAGLIVIDFIDMNDKSHIKAVEKRLKDCIKLDRARIQIGHISSFGLLEMSRQRLRSSVLESTTQPCPHCQGTGAIQSDSSSTLQLIRKIETCAISHPYHNIEVYTSAVTALYILNNKRHLIADIESRFDIKITIKIDEEKNGEINLFIQSPAERSASTYVAPTENTSNLAITQKRTERNGNERAEALPQTIEADNSVSAPAIKTEEKESASSRRRKRRKNQKAQSTETLTEKNSNSEVAVNNRQAKHSNKKANKYNRNKNDRYKRRVYIAQPEPVGPMAPEFFNLMRIARLHRRLWRGGLPRVEAIGQIANLYPEFKEPNKFQQFMYKRYNFRDKYNKAGKSDAQNTINSTSNLTKPPVAEVEFVNLIVPSNYKQQLVDSKAALLATENAKLDVADSNNLATKSSSEVAKGLNKAKNDNIEANEPNRPKQNKSNKKRNARSNAGAKKNIDINAESSESIADAAIENSADMLMDPTKALPMENESSSQPLAAANNKKRKRVVKSTKANATDTKNSLEIEPINEPNPLHQDNVADKVMTEQTKPNSDKKDKNLDMKDPDVIEIEIKDLGMSEPRQAEENGSKPASVRVSSSVSENLDEQAAPVKKVGWWQRK